MVFHVSLAGRKNLSGELYRQIRRAILNGRLRRGDRLSPSRDLARALAISRMTVIVAYWISSRWHSGGICGANGHAGP